jgi:hypothetical protein
MSITRTMCLKLLLLLLLLLHPTTHLQHIIELASPRLVKSDVKLRHGEGASKAASQRSSAGVFLRR